MAVMKEEDRIKAHRKSLAEIDARLEKILEEAQKRIYSDRDFIARSMRKGLIVNPKPRKSRSTFDLKELNRELWMN